jgi:hypothetical protein
MNFFSSVFHKISENVNLFQEQVHDTYKSSLKLPEPSVCSCCGAVYHEGRWQWLPEPHNAHQETCSACHRIHDHYPAGFLSLKGDFIKLYRFEIMQLLHNLEINVRAEYPLKRIMNVEERINETLMTTTDIHLARSMGEALHHAYQGEMAFDFDPEHNLLRVNWMR